jgi:hypothetical protein
MKLKSYALLILISCFALCLSAQTAPMIEFVETTHDFGEVKQNDKTETVFKFKNVSKDTLRLTNVKPGCSCTTPKWSQEVIQPGGTGEITAGYNSSRAGVFNKNITVQHSGAPEPIMLFIKGNVIAVEAEHPAGDHTHADGTVHPATPVIPAAPSIDYSIPRGALSFEKMIETIKGVSSEETQFAEYRFKNTSGQTVKILTDKTEVESGLSVVVKDNVLAPGQESVVKVIVDGKKLKADKTADGFFSKRITIMTDEAEGAGKLLSLNGTYTRILTDAEKANSPKIEFETVDINGGKIIEGENFVYDFKFKNTGSAPLVIESAKASCGCTAATPPVESIQPGGQSAITAKFDSKGRVGSQSKTITVRSNDVNNPTIVLKFTVEVVKDPFHAGSMMGGSN